MRKTKIIATLGPATFKPEKIQKLVMAGLDVVRINMSHEIPFDLLEELIHIIRQESQRAEKSIAIIYDIDNKF